VTTDAKQVRVFRVTSAVAAFVAATAILQHYGILVYRGLVDHLPGTLAVSGPWALAAAAPADSALGTLSFNHIYAGHFIGIGIIILLLFRGRLSAIRLGLLAVMLIGLLVTQAQTAPIAVASGVAYGLVRAPRVRYKRGVVVGLILGAGLLLFIGGVDQLGSEAIDPRGKPVAESVGERFSLHGGALGLLSMDVWTPLLGVGPGNLGLFLVGGGFSPAHGQYVTVLVELGAFGLIIFVWLYARVFSSIRRETEWGLATRAVWIAIFVSAVFNDILLPSPAFGSLLAFLFCLAGTASWPPRSTT
jgi:hypothetical protein